MCSAGLERTRRTAFLYLCALLANSRHNPNASIEYSAMKYAVKLTTNGTGRTDHTISAIVTYAAKNTIFPRKAAVINDVSRPGLAAKVRAISVHETLAAASGPSMPARMSTPNRVPTAAIAAPQPARLAMIIQAATFIAGTSPSRVRRSRRSVPAQPRPAGTMATLRATGPGAHRSHQRG